MQGTSPILRSWGRQGYILGMAKRIDWYYHRKG